jgi:hypothetical protein
MQRDEEAIRKDAHMWSLVAELQSLVTLREGMLAENTFRMLCDNQISYGEEVFIELSKRMESLSFLLDKNF